MGKDLDERTTGVAGFGSGMVISLQMVSAPRLLSV